MVADFYIPRLSNDMKIAVQKNHLGGQILHRSLNPCKKRRQRDGILDVSIKNCGLDEDGLDGLSNWYRRYVINRYDRTDLLDLHLDKKSGTSSRRESLKTNRKFDKPHNVRK